jgi:hypothetical protein
MPVDGQRPNSINSEAKPDVDKSFSYLIIYVSWTKGMCSISDNTTELFG